MHRTQSGFAPSRSPRGTDPAADLDLRFLDRATDLPGPGWDVLIGQDDFFLSQRWLQVTQATAGVPMRFLLAQRGDCLVGGLPTALADHTAPWLLGRPDTLLARSVSGGRAGAAELRDRLPGGDPAVLLPSLVCGGRHLGRNRVPAAPEAGERVLTELVRQAEHTARSQGAASVAFQFVDGHDHSLRRVLTERGYLSYESGVYSWLPLPPGGFDGYLGQLGARRRRRVLAERRSIASAGVDTRIEPLTAAMVPRLAELETQLYHKYGQPNWRPEVSEQGIFGILAILADDALLCVSRADGDIRGFGLILRFRNTWYAHRAGFDYDYQGTLPLYFETLYYHPIEAAEACGVTTIHYGMGSEDAKRSRGCSASTQHCYVRLLERS